MNLKKKKLKLNLKGKYLASIILIIVAIIVYNTTIELGELAQTNNVYLVLCISDWCYLLFIQFILLTKKWEKKKRR